LTLIPLQEEGLAALFGSTLLVKSHLLQRHHSKRTEATEDKGRIRLDDADGSVANAPSFDVINSSGSSASRALTSYDSDIILVVEP